MGVQVRTDFSNLAFVLMGTGKVKVGTVVQDAGRTGAMVRHTLMARNPATLKWNSFTDETATDGTQFPRGILMADLTEAEIKAGDVADVPILVGGEITDKNQITIENSKTLATVINVPTNFNTTVEDYLAMVGIYMQDTDDIDSFEN
jgi:hypothetical protein